MYTPADTKHKGKETEEETQKEWVLAYSDWGNGCLVIRAFTFQELFYPNT